MLDNQLSNFLINILWTKVVLLKNALYNQMSVIVGLQKKLWLHNCPSSFGKYEEANLCLILNFWLEAFEWQRNFREWTLKMPKFKNIKSTN